MTTTNTDNPDDLKFKSACRKLLNMVLDGTVTDDLQLGIQKKKISGRYKLSTLPKNADIIMAGNDEEQKQVKETLRRKPIRTISGVAVVAAMTSPAPCPHGICIPCPGGPDSSFSSPQSYMGREPATMRAIQNDYDPYKQVTSRLTQLKTIGHEIDKVELIVMGGTFSARPLDYQEWFTKRCLEAMNDFYDIKWRSNVHNIGIKYPYVTVEDVQKANETAKIRNTGITFETRPDWAREEHVDRMLVLGGTKVEIGVQSVYDFVLSRIERGHTVSDTVEANRILRDSGLKVGFHMMPQLPGVDAERDLRGFKKLFTDPRFMPDYLKIYPTLVTEGTRLYDMWKRGEYRAHDHDETVDLIADMKSILPKWVRLQRIQRDIPAQQIFCGVTKSNIRQLAEKRLHERGGRCRCIRCREVGHNILKGTEPNIDDIELTVESYNSCGGIEHFISFEDVKQDILIGFLRLRFPCAPHRSELDGAALIRELHIYGSMVPIGGSVKGMNWQHRGYGAELLLYAEKLTRDNGYRKLSIISGIGVREYYRKFGYSRDGPGPYMSKIV